MADITTIQGRLIIKYDPSDLSGQQVLERLVHINEKKDIFSPEIVVSIVFNGQSGNEIFHKSPEHLPSKALAPKSIEHVGLFFPVSSGDKRWRTISFTTSGLYLGSALRESGFSVTCSKFNVPGKFQLTKDPPIDVAGVSLIEDMFLEVKEVIEDLSAEHQSPILVAGGPMVTLHPMATVFHLPKVNLFIRGEGEGVFPQALMALKEGCIEKLLELEGIFYQEPGLIILSHWDKVNRPAEISLSFDYLDFLSSSQLTNGLEANFSRGCRYGCLFCSKVQGYQYRKLSLSNVSDLLASYQEKLTDNEISEPYARTVNINDDDILQDVDYAKDVFLQIKNNGFQLWGIQSSLDSFYTSSWEINNEAVSLAGDRESFVKQKPLVWLGTDVFIHGRGKRLGKRLPPFDRFCFLLEDFEERGILNYHYWISSDHRSNWMEFVTEFELITYLLKKYKYFNLLAHSPFVVPYPSSPLYREIVKDGCERQIKVKEWLTGPHRAFELPLVERVVTGFPFLNQLLENMPLEQNQGFFDFLKNKDIRESWITIYTFIKKERLSIQNNEPLTESLVGLENRVEDIIVNL